MAYNLYSVQMARAWGERIDKETKIAERFWSEQALKSTQEVQQQGVSGQGSPRAFAGGAGYAASTAPSAVPTGYTSKSSFLKDRLDKLEQELIQEKEYRLKVEEELAMLKTAPRPGSQPGTPRGGKPGTPRGH